MELPDQTDVNKAYQRRQFLCEIGDQREKETRFHNMKGGDSCKLKYSEVKSEEEYCERCRLCFQAACSEMGAGARSLLCSPVSELLCTSLALEMAQLRGRESFTWHLPSVLQGCRAGGAHVLLGRQLPHSSASVSWCFAQKQVAQRTGWAHPVKA